MAQIIQHPRAAATTVIQTRRQGRHPAMVIAFWRLQNKRAIRQMEIDAALKVLEKLELRANVYEGEWHTARYALAIAKQKLAKGQQP